jgi:hypothetical protein
MAMNHICGRIDENTPANGSTKNVKGCALASEPLEMDSDEYSDPDFSYSEESGDESLSSPIEDLIFKRSLLLEREIPRSSAQMISTQSDFNPLHRERAIHRIIELNYRFQLSSDALYNAVCYFDIVLSNVSIAPTDFELVASVCYWISSKVDTRYEPTVDKINDTIGTTFTLSSFKSMEITILKALKFQLTFPTAKFFMRHIFKKSLATEPIFNVSNLLVEVALLKFKFVDVFPSVLAASAIAISWAGIGNMEMAHVSIKAASCVDLELFNEPMKSMVGYAERFVSSRGEDEGGIRGLMRSMDFKFDIHSLLRDADQALYSADEL